MNTMTIAYNLVFENLEELLYEDFLNLDVETQSEIDYTDFENYVFKEEFKIAGYLRNIDFTEFVPPKAFNIGEEILFMDDFVVDILSPLIKEGIQSQQSIDKNTLNSDIDKFENCLIGETFIISNVQNVYIGTENNPPNGKLDIDYILKYDIKEKIEGYKEKMSGSIGSKENITSTTPVEQFPKEWTTK